MSDLNILRFHSLVFTVSNAKTASSYFIRNFGFKSYAYKGLETIPEDGNRDFAYHAVTCNDILFVFKSPLKVDFVGNDFVSHINVVVNGTTDAAPYMSKRVTLNFLQEAEAADYFSEKNHWKLTDDHRDVAQKMIDSLYPVSLKFIDHVVSNYAEGDMEKICDYMEKNFNMHRFWSVDEDVIHTDYSSLRSVVMANKEENVLLPINEPAKGLKKSQIEEYLDFNGNVPGVQHIALRSNDIISDVVSLRARGVKFLSVPAEYYDDLKMRLSKSKCVVKEDIAVLQREHILVDFDDNGYLLQIFTDAVDYRPTIFFEIIQRHNHNGFGSGNFFHLFKYLESAQQERGNLTDI